MLILGLYLDPPHIREALIQKGRSGISVRSLQTSLLGTSQSNVKPLYMTDFRGRIVTGVSAKDSLIRLMEMKVGPHRHREEVIAFQAEATSHFQPGEMLHVPLFSLQKGGKETLLFTVPRLALQDHLQELEKWGIDPDAVSSLPAALCHFARWKYPELLDALIVDIGSHEWTCVWMEQGKLKKAHFIPGGVEALLANLLEDRRKILLKEEIEGAAKQIDLLLLKAGLNPHLTDKLNELRHELARVRHAFDRGGEKRTVLFTGRTDAFIHLAEFLVDGFENQWPLTLEEQKFAIPIGLALSQTVSHPLQLRKEEFFPRKNWRKMGLYALSLCAASILISGALFFFGLRQIQSRKEKMLASVTASSQKRKLDLQGTIEEKIDRWIGAVETTNKEYPYLLQAPKVAEVLSWLASHPLLAELKNEGDPIEIESVRYQLVKFPKIGATSDPYLAHVELDFSFKSAMNARKFHEALRTGDAWVDPDQEITWDTVGSAYRTTFFLKNRSPHVY